MPTRDDRASNSSLHVPIDPKTTPFMIADTPSPPYYAVIFTSLSREDDPSYEKMAKEMAELAARQPGYLGFESARSGLGITVSYWKDLESITKWKNVLQHREARRLGREKWYASYRVRIAEVTRDYSMQSDDGHE